MQYRMIGDAKVSLLGYGCMRFPKDGDGRIDAKRSEALLRRAYEGGVNYFDTAFNYHGGQSEPFVGKMLQKLPRDSFYIATKFPTWMPDDYSDADALFNEQLAKLRTDHIDFYLMHALTAERWEKINKLGMMPYFDEQVKNGRIRRLGFSFHDSYEAFESIIRSRKWDFCQIQFNYMDTEHQAGEKGIALAESLGVPNVVMEPVKGGALATLPESVTAPIAEVNPDASQASWAFRFIESYKNVSVILSGMSDEEQLEDNLKTFDKPNPLSSAEKAALDKTAALLRARTNNGCTACRYCMPCPNGVDIPGSFGIWNAFARYGNAADAKAELDYLAKAGPSGCIGCGKCETMCPQHIEIRSDLKKILGESWAK